MNFSKSKMLISVFIMILMISCSLSGPSSDSKDKKKEKENVDTGEVISSDRTAPVINSMTVNSVNISGSGTISLSVNAADEGGAGINKIKARMVSSISDQVMNVELSLDSVSGLWKADFVFHTYQADGEWIIDQISIWDNVYNINSYSYENEISEVYYCDNNMSLSSLKLIKINANTFSPDLTLPLLIAVSAAPGTVNGSGSVLVKVGAFDENNVAKVELEIEGTERDYLKEISLAYNNVSGFWEGSVNFSKYDANGIWTISYIAIYDTAGNKKKYDSDSLVNNYYRGDDNVSTSIPVVTVTVNTSEPDLIFPVLKSISAAPAEITGSGIAAITIDASDEGSGISDIYLEFTHISGAEFYLLMNYKDSSKLWEGKAFFYPDYNSGEWVVSTIYLRDISGNVVHYIYDASKSATNYYIEESSFVSARQIIKIYKN